MKNYAQLNKIAWNTKTAIHIDSEFYDNKSFIAGKCSLKDPELSLFEDVQGKSILHLQCHFGQDSISLARRGAKVTGVDLSDDAIKKAKELAELVAQTENTNFICSDVLQLKNVLISENKFDYVFASYGTIGWLPDINAWGDIVTSYLKEGGKLVFVEFHPAIWMYDDDLEFVKYRYFNSQPIHEVIEGSYTDGERTQKQEIVTWNHGLAEVQMALINQGMTIQKFEEYDYSSYDCFPEMFEFEKDKFRTKKFEDKIPMMYSLLAEKN